MGAKFGRIHRKTFRNPLGFGKNPSRFSDPSRRVQRNRFGVLYLGSSLKVCFLETMLRDDRDGIVGQIAIAESELDDRRYAEIRVGQPLRLLDLTGDGPVRMGIPSDVARGRRQALARKWSVAFHEHPQQLDGIVYPSRLNGETNLAIYGRAVGKLELWHAQDLKRAAGLADVLDDFLVALL
ncbi:MAG: RES family NAD+ phosphorylase [Bradyrhizobium sp.]|nr:RES family NAD+ phosphorylase [Bradyrhizobium sp.]